MKPRDESLSRVEQEIGGFVRSKRKAAGLSQEALAERCGIVRRTLFSLEAGEGGNLRTLLSVLAELGELESATRSFSLRPPTRPAPEAPEAATAKEEEEETPKAGNPWVMTDHAVL
ncbi:helix-turn-helix domain-containing protein [Puniceicoccus vermicola]|uniref:Helix-turn-helix domain-containing protein n=1 Tax=Puniceicoccus vermicola TaxID=388746 RepID=A0A7X1E3I4_9BACT|nr:helix-turn-helix domain-containing protein [Puniceicoccus vermicola]MBC2601520.1 helix-turn-helix domain-containing protein [Puniceicoccus vermicola]